MGSLIAKGLGLLAAGIISAVGIEAGKKYVFPLIDQKVQSWDTPGPQDTATA